MRRAIAVTCVIGAFAALAGSAGAKVLRVGSFHGIAGQYATIQAAVNAAHRGDWILVGPGDYKTTPASIHAPRGAAGFPAAVVITTPDLHIVGMNRNTVIVDGTKPGSSACSRQESAQNFGPHRHVAVSGYAVSAAADSGAGVNGLMVWKAPNVSIENLTACNFLGGMDGDGQTGNEIWWNGGAGSGRIGGHGFHGAYLTTTSTFLKGKSAADEVSAAQYGVFSSNWSGGTWDNIYASNFNDSGFYIGACQQQCDQTVDHAWGQYNALGYSGSNSGGRLVIENSQFDHNEDGFDTNSQNGDNPPPQNGACPHNGISSITHTHSCWVFIHNYVHDNNNPNVPAAGEAAAGPVGTGMSISGGRNDTVMDNRFAHNDAWGIVVVPFLDSGGPCTGGVVGAFGKGSCLFDQWGDAIVGNRFTDNGSYGHPTNGDWAEEAFQPGPTGCYSANVDTGGSLTADDLAQQQASPLCTGQTVAASSTDSRFLGEVLCDSQVELSPGTPASCPSGPYPRVTKIVMHPLPTRQLRTMPDPCAGVPANPWCGRRRS